MIRNLTHEILTHYGFRIAGLTYEKHFAWWRKETNHTSSSSRRKGVLAYYNVMLDAGWVPRLPKAPKDFHFWLTCEGLEGQIFNTGGGEYQFLITNPLTKAGVDIFVKKNGELIDG